MEELKEKKQAVKSIKRALLVEDDKPCYTFMTYYLNDLDYQVDLADEYPAAIQAIQDNIYDLMIVDVNLQGIRVGKKIIQMTRESELNIGTPIIAWSAYFNKNDEEEYLAWGADTALIKACGFKGLEEAIWKCLVTPRYQREFHYKLRILKKRWQENGPAEWEEQINGLHHLSYSALDEAFHLISESHSNLHAEEEKRLS